MKRAASQPAGTQVHVDIYSDIAWPWCYVGDRELKKAMEGEGAGDVTVRYRPYMIDPRTQPGGEDYMQYNERRWGSDGWTHSLRARGKGLGCGFRGWRWWPNTLNAHRLCHFLEVGDAADGALGSAERERRGLALVDKLYELTYERGENISTVAGAVAAARELGFPDPAAAERYLSDGKGEEEVRQLDEQAKRGMRISGVPYFVLSRDGRRPQALSGAQSAAAFRAAIAELRQ